MGEAPELPPILAAIAEVTSIDVALSIARARGGTRVTVPTIANGNNWLTDLVGEASAAAIIVELGAARRIDVPLGPAGGAYLRSLRQARQERARQMSELEARNASAAEIARALGVTDRAVRFRRAERRRLLASGQGELFD